MGGMPSSSASEPGSYLSEWKACWDEMEAHRFTDTDRNVVLAKFLYRTENVVLVHGKGQYDDPLLWMQALEKARGTELEEHKALTEEHGYPDTSSMTLQEGHFARLSFLMRKYPEADWDLLMDNQETAMERKPTATKVPETTVQGIEKTKKRFLALREQRTQLMRSGENPELLTSVVSAMGRARLLLERRGVSTTELIQSSGTTRKPDGTDDTEKPEVVLENIKSAAPQASELSVVAGNPDVKRKTLTPREVADIMGIAYKTVLQHLESGQIPHGIKVGNRWVVQQSQFEEWFKGRQREEAPAPKPPRVKVDHLNPPRNNGDFRPSF